MASGTRAVTPQTLGCWVVKGSRDVSPVDELVRTRFAAVAGWCLRPTYRTDMIRRGQHVLFWISGQDGLRPAGIYAQGHTTASPESVAEEPGERGKPKLFLPMRLEPLPAPVLRSEILEQPVLSQIEVMKMPAGSNPSYLTRDQLAELRAGWPQVTVG